MLATKPAFQKEILRQTGLEIEAILSPISPDQPSGSYLRYQKEYEEIEECRRRDDPNLPQGVWIHELKKADWARVSSLCLECLTDKSKDIQLGVWLLESLIYQHGFPGLTSGCIILEQLCEQFWESIYPPIQNDDLEYRTNPIQWANDNLLPALNLIPITLSPKEHKDLNWADWERALLIERAENGAKSSNGNGYSNDIVLLKDFHSFIETTPTAFYKNLYRQLLDAAEAVDAFSYCLDETCGDAAPSFRKILSLLEELQTFTGNILQERGVPRSFAEQEGGSDNEDSTGSGGGSGNIPDIPGEFGGGGGGTDDGSFPDFAPGPEGPIQNRQQAYAQLQQAAEYIMRIEPHSPVPYLITLAINWGKMSTAELYRELFMKGQGQLSIFEILGIKPEDNSNEPPFS